MSEQAKRITVFEQSQEEKSLLDNDARGGLQLELLQSIPDVSALEYQHPPLCSFLSAQIDSAHFATFG